MVKTTEPLPWQPWHDVAIAMRDRHCTHNEIAAEVDKDVTCIRKVLYAHVREATRKRGREAMRARLADPVLRDELNARRRKHYAKRKKENDRRKQSGAAGLRSPVRDVAQGDGARL